MKNAFSSRFRAKPQHQGGGGGDGEEEDHVSTFKTSLQSIPIVPSCLAADDDDDNGGGLPVMRVKASGIIQNSLLRLSSDRFTLFLTTTNNNSTSNKNSKNKNKKQQSSSNYNSSTTTNHNSSTTTSRLSSLILLRSRSHPSPSSNNNAGNSTTNLLSSQNTPTIDATSSFPISTSAFTTTTSTTNLSSASTAATISEQHSIDVGTIDRIQRGQVTHKFEMALKSVQQQQQQQQQCSSLFQPTKSLSIVFRGGSKTLDLLCSTEAQRDKLVDTLETILQAYQTAKAKVSNEVLLLRYIWMDNNGGISPNQKSTGLINVHDLSKLLEHINYHMKKRALQNAYDRFANRIGLDRSQRKRGLTFEQTSTFLHKLKRDSWMVKPVEIIWGKLFGEIMNNGKPRTNVSCTSFLQKFLKDKQGETRTTMEQVKRLFRKLNQMEMPNAAVENQHDPTGDSRIDRNRFEAYLFSKDNDAFSPNRERFDRRRMTKPISEYWINSSHNTYLTGDQLTSHSSVEMYMSALYRGCRCLELDVWDHSSSDYKKQQQYHHQTADQTTTTTSTATAAAIASSYQQQLTPVVWHSHTMTSKILFVDIIKCLKTFMDFHPQTYPLILSFENHCSIPYQEVMAQELEAILGNTLYIPTETSLFGRLPSPEDLRGMIVIKGRRPDDAVIDDDEDDDSDDGSDDELEPNKTASLHSEFTTSTTSTGSSSKPKKQQTKTKIAPALARLTLLHGCKLKNWDDSILNPTHHMHSFSESKVKKLFRQGTSRGMWAIYNQSHMSRTYPAGSRVDSSNYSPVLAWSSGCQMVALNFQTPDAPLKINDGRFRENGQCGYVLKPTTIVVKDELAIENAPVSLSIRVLSGSCLPKPRGQRTGDCINPYVKVAVFDVKKKEKEFTASFSTNSVQDNGYFPIWHNAMDREQFTFMVDNADVAILHLEVYSKGDCVVTKDDFIAFSSIPISCLRQGYRSVQLMDANNTRHGLFSFASLLVEIKMKRVPVVAEI